MLVITFLIMSPRFPVGSVRPFGHSGVSVLRRSTFWMLCAPLHTPQSRSGDMDPRAERICPVPIGIAFRTRSHRHLIRFHLWDETGRLSGDNRGGFDRLDRVAPLSGERRVLAVIRRDRPSYSSPLPASPLASQPPLSVSSNSFAQFWSSGDSGSWSRSCRKSDSGTSVRTKSTITRD